MVHPVRLRQLLKTLVFQIQQLKVGLLLILWMALDGPAEMVSTVFFVYNNDFNSLVWGLCNFVIYSDG